MLTRLVILCYKMAFVKTRSVVRRMLSVTKRNRLTLGDISFVSFERYAVDILSHMTINFKTKLEGAISESVNYSPQLVF